MKFGMDVMPLGTTPNLYFTFPAVRNSNLIDAHLSRDHITLGLSR